MGEPDDGTDADAATRAALVRVLAAQRRHVLGILEGLSDAQLRAARLPSGWSALGLVNHLAKDVEHYWFCCVLGGEPIEPRDEGPDGATHSWRVEPDVPASAVLQAYRDEAAAADRVLATARLDDPPQQADPWWGEWSVPDVRFVILHVIAETACHAGHLDAARELTDGTQWLTL